MKRYMTRVCLLLLTSVLVSCGGGGDSSSGGSPGTSSGGNPGNDGGSNSANGGGMPSAGAHVEESGAAVTLSGDWKPVDASPGDCKGNPCSFGWSGGKAIQSTAAHAMASFTFTGTSVTWIGSRGKRGGKALARVDGGSAIPVDLYDGLNDEIRTPVLTINGLSDGQHTLTIEVTGTHGDEALASVVVVDAFDVQAPTVSHLQEAEPPELPVDRRFLTYSDRSLTFSGGWGEAGGALKWSGGDAQNFPEPEIRAKVTETAGATATLKFRGTGIRWIGYRGPDAGGASVSVDGGTPTPIEMYSPEIKVQEVVFTATGLADTNHTLTITVTGQKNAASSAAKVYVDGFDVMTPGRRYQENFVSRTDADPSITYSPGNWHSNTARVWSEGRVVKSDDPNASVTFSFVGTSVSWIGCAKSSIGTARVFLDGVDLGVVNQRRNPGQEAYQRTMYRADNLTNGPHTLTIKPVSGLTVIDAFDINP
ncbi:MAG TPA: hypothetical protein VE958_09945 [Bryobacteraceae bacterium]|nr:hypothetical protein [Bryobacteraceae bacterium]